MSGISRGALSQVMAGMLLTAFASRAYAQSSPKQYVFGGWSLGWREGSAKVAESNHPQSVLNGVTFGGGVSVASNATFEVALSAFSPTTTDWHFSYISGTNGDKRTEDRDFLVTALIRWSQPCAGVLCVDILAGGGFTVHAVSTTALTNCVPPVGPCVDLDPPRAEQEPSHLEPLLIGGLDFRVRISKRLTLLPGVRAGHIWRKEFLTDYSFRGPREGSGLFYTANVAVLYAFK